MNFFGEHLALSLLSVNYEYTAYGLSLRSDAELPGLTQANGIPASEVISLSISTKPEWVREASRLSAEIIHSLPAAPECADPAFVVRSFDGGRFFQLCYSDGTDFFVDERAERVWGNCPSPLAIEDLSTYLLGPVMGFVLRRRSVTPLHASAVRLDDVAVAIAGPAAAGKSTTAAALALRGAPVLCEDIAALCEDQGRFHVQPGYPRVCLWPDAVEKLLGSEDALPDLTPTWQKKYLGLDGAKAKFEPRRMPLGAIYLLGARANEKTAPRLEEISAREALLELVSNTYMNRLLTREHRAAEFEFLSRLVNQVPCKRLIPHDDATRIGKLCQLIVEDARTAAAERHPPVPARQG